LTRRPPEPSQDMIVPQSIVRALQDPRPDSLFRLFSHFPVEVLNDPAACRMALWVAPTVAVEKAS